MAKENIMKFLEAAIGNRTLADKLSALAGEHGYQFTAEELQSLAAATPADKIFRNGGGTNVLVRVIHMLKKVIGRQSRRFSLMRRQRIYQEV